MGLFGVLMRYKIGFEFPYFSQKNIQHGHSHFAFSGWVSHTLYALLIFFLSTKTEDGYWKQYKNLLICNLLCAYGMLISFAIQGYGAVSIVFSTSTILISCLFAYYFFKDVKKLSQHNSVAWFKAALWFNILSSLGTFYLVYMMISKNFNEHLYLASVYFYLHFQYNGFFIFTCFGLFFSQIETMFPQFKYKKLFFNLFLYSFIPAYFLSILWAKLPIWLYSIVVVAAFTQLFAWYKIVKGIKIAVKFGNTLNKFQTYLFLFVAIAYTIKLLLQLGSTIPAVSTLAFGFRPIVIAYLHLVLLGVISVFLLSYIYTFKLISANKTALVGLSVFTIGVFLNELVLAVQGVASFSYIVVKHVNGILFGVSLILLLGSILIIFTQTKSVKP